MLSLKAQLESKVQDKVGHLIIDQDCPTGYIKEMLYQFIMYVGQLETQAAAQQAAVQSTEAPAETKVEPIAEVQQDVPQT